jgi:3-methyladenine DNA glycosylase AlkC
VTNDAPPSSQPSSSLSSQRKGARRRVDIPEGVLAALNTGELPTASLVEWLAVDMLLLLERVLPWAGLRAAAPAIVARAESLAGGPITAFMAGVGALLYEAAAHHSAPNEVFAAFGSHPSDIVRGWAAFMIGAADERPLAARLALLHRFAIDPHPLVREHAWYAARPAIVADLAPALSLLGAWTRDHDARARRFAVEVTRPRGVWCAHCDALKAHPEQAFALLDRLRADPSRYVQVAVGNWLNDASKTRPDWVKDVCARWAADPAADASTGRILARASRTLTITQGDEAAPVARHRRRPML